MTPLDKIHLAVEDLRDRGVRKATAAPLFYRFLWSLRIAIPPPLYQSFLGLVVVHGLLFGVPLGSALAMADRQLAPDGATVMGTLGGAVFGVVMAAYFRWAARRLALPRWSDYLQAAGSEAEEGW